MSSSTDPQMNLSPGVVLLLCIIGACVLVLTAYAVSRMLRKNVPECEESALIRDPFHNRGKEQDDYMKEVRVRMLERTSSLAAMQHAMDQRHALLRNHGPYPFAHNSDSSGSSGTSSRYTGNNFIYREDDLAIEQQAQPDYENLPFSDSLPVFQLPPRHDSPSHEHQHSPVLRESRTSLMIEEWERRNGQFSKTYEALNAGGLKLDNRF